MDVKSKEEIIKFAQKLNLRLLEYTGKALIIKTVVEAHFHKGSA